MVDSDLKSGVLGGTSSYNHNSLYITSNLKVSGSSGIVVTKLDYSENTISNSKGYKIDGENITFECISSSDNADSIFVAGLRSSGQSIILKIDPDSLNVK